MRPNGDYPSGCFCVLDGCTETQRRRFLLYQYAASTKEETLAGLKGIVPVLERKVQLVKELEKLKSQQEKVQKKIEQLHF